MDVFVTGGTGAIGREAVGALIDAGHTVRALARSDEKARRLADQGATPVEVSLFEEDALTVVQESVALLYPDNGTAWITEDTPPDRFSIAEANLTAEANAERFTAGGGNGVVLRFGWFYGPGAKHAEEFLALARQGLCVSMGPDNSYVSSIHVADGGRAVAAALTAPAGVYNVVDDTPLTKRQYADALAAAAGRPARIRAPGRAARLLGDKTIGLRRSLRVSNQRFRAATGWSPKYPSANEGWAATAAVLNQHRR